MSAVAIADLREITDDRTLRITLPRRDDDGVWHANVSFGGVTRTFHNRYGSWMTERRSSDEWPEHAVRREALPFVAAALQAKMQKIEGREQRAVRRAE